MYLSLPLICFFTHGSDFCHWLFCSILFVVCPQSVAICHFCHNCFNLSGQIKFSLCLKTWSFSPWFPSGSPLQSIPICLAASFVLTYLSWYFMVSAWLYWFVLLSLTWFENSFIAKAFVFLPFSSCIVLHTLGTQCMFDDWELAVLDFPLFLIGWAREFSFSDKFHMLWKPSKAMIFHLGTPDSCCLNFWECQS